MKTLNPSRSAAPYPSAPTDSSPAQFTRDQTTPPTTHYPLKTDH